MSSVPVPSSTSEDSICDVDIKESIVLQKLMELKVNKALVLMVFTFTS